MGKRSAGLLLFRRCARAVEVLLAHPGGPYFAKREYEIWSVPKGLLEPGESAFDAARREFLEETGLRPPASASDYLALGSIRYKSGKTVEAWAFEDDCDPRDLRSNTISLEWPPRSGRSIDVPEVDRFDFFDLREAESRLLPAQRPLLRVLAERLTQQDE